MRTLSGYYFHPSHGHVTRRSLARAIFTSRTGGSQRSRRGRPRPPVGDRVAKASRCTTTARSAPLNPPPPLSHLIPFHFPFNSGPPCLLGLWTPPPPPLLSLTRGCLL